VLTGVAEAPEAARELGLRARERVRARFDWDRIAAETAGFYREVMAGRGRAPVARASGSAAGAAPAAPADPAPGLREREGT
jgi:hypothetical protein